MPFKKIRFDTPKEMMEIAQPLFDEMHRSAVSKDGFSGGVLLDICQSTRMGVGFFIPYKAAMKIKKIIAKFEK